MSKVPPDILAWRKHTGADRWDEMWDGVLHMVPCPNRDHQDLEGALETWLRTHWAPRTGGKVYHQINVARPGTGEDWRRDYRVPDLVLLTPARFSIDRNEYFAGGPDAVVEIRSPDDETDEKLRFYGEIGVCEVWVVDRDSKACELHVLGDGSHSVRRAAPGEWLASALGIELRSELGTEPECRLALRLAGDDASLGLVP
jgi:Uma2 family endonuclease